MGTRALAKLGTRTIRPHGYRHTRYNRMSVRRAGIKAPKGSVPMRCVLSLTMSSSLHGCRKRLPLEARAPPQRQWRGSSWHGAHHANATSWRREALERAGGGGADVGLRGGDVAQRSVSERGGDGGTDVTSTRSRASATLTAIRRLVAAAAARVGRRSSSCEPWIAARHVGRSAASLCHDAWSMLKLSSAL